jgi:hypothetical protein
MALFPLGDMVGREKRHFAEDIKSCKDMKCLNSSSQFCFHFVRSIGTVYIIVIF